MTPRGACTSTDAMYVFRIDRDQDPLSFMAILQSRLLLFLYRIANEGESRVIPQIKASKLHTLPYPRELSATPPYAALSRQCTSMLSLHRQLAEAKLDAQKTAIQRQIDCTDHEIDMLVYELYGLSDDEIAIVESAQSA